MYSSSVVQQPAIIISSPSGGRPNNSNSEKSTNLHSMISGAAVGTISCVLSQPFDLVKTRLQLSTSLLSSVSVNSQGNVAEGLVRKNYIYNTVIRVIQQDSYKGLWRGLTPSFYRTVPGTAMYFYMLHRMKNSFYPSRKPTCYENLGLGFVARGSVGSVMLPFTVIKTRYESGYYQYKTVGHALKDIWKVEGTKGLFSGWTATICRDAPYAGIYYMFYSGGKNIVSTSYQRNLVWHENLVCGFAAGTSACLLTQPMDVVKTRMQLNPSRYNGTVNCVVTILNENGMTGLFRGMSVRIARKATMSALSWACFEEIMKIVKYYT